jgi:hypothetical protein
MPKNPVDCRKDNVNGVDLTTVLLIDVVNPLVQRDYSLAWNLPMNVVPGESVYGASGSSGFPKIVISEK